MDRQTDSHGETSIPPQLRWWGIQTNFQCGEIVEKWPPWRSKFHGRNNFFTTLVQNLMLKFEPCQLLTLKNVPRSHFQRGHFFMLHCLLLDGVGVRGRGNWELGSENIAQYGRCSEKEDLGWGKGRKAKMPTPCTTWLNYRRLPHATNTNSNKEKMVLSLLINIHPPRLHAESSLNSSVIKDMYIPYRIPCFVSQAYKFINEFFWPSFPPSISQYHLRTRFGRDNWHNNHLPIVRKLGVGAHTRTPHLGPFYGEIQAPVAHKTNPISIFYKYY